MNAAIVYQGVNGQYEGTIFNGLKFFIHSVVPGKHEVEEKIKSNGGKVVLLENKADVKLGDPALPKRAPEGFVSYKFIDHCIEKGTICDIDRFRIHRDVLPPGRPGVSSTGAKTTRKSFTPQEDSVLIKWVLQQTPAGQARKGQKIYDKLVEKLVQENSVHKNAHTAQSWRDRWVKNFDGRPLSDLQSYLNTPDSPAQPAQSAPVQHVRPQPARQELDDPGPASSVPSTQREHVAPKKRAKFTEAEDEMLLEYVADRVKSGEKALGNKIYQELYSYGQEYQTHTAQSWLARYKLLTERLPASTTSSALVPNPAKNRLPIPTREVVDLTRRDGPRHDSESVASPIRFSVPRIPGDHMDIIRELSKRRSNPRVATPGGPSGLNIIPVGDMPIEDLIQVTKAVKGIQTAWRGYNVRRKLGPKVKIEQDDAVPLLDPGLEDQRAKARRAKAESEFYDRLRAYHKQLKFSHYKTVYITVRGEKMVLPLWELWRAVVKDEPDHSLRDWKKVSQNFRIDGPGVADQLKSAFEKHLLDFEKLLRDHLANAADDSDLESDDIGSDEEEEEDDEDAQSDGFTPDPQLPELPSLPPPVIGIKRTIDRVETSPDAEIVDPTPKRRRYKSTDEIPCSPELTRQPPPRVTAEPEGSPRLLPVLPKETPKRAKAVIPSIETDQPDFTPTQQLLSENDMGRHGDGASDSTASDLESDAFDPPVVAQEPRRRTLPKSWTKPDERSPAENSRRDPSDWQPSHRLTSSITHRSGPPPPPPKQTPPSRSVSVSHRPGPSANPPAGQSASHSRSASARNSASSSQVNSKPGQAMIDEFISLGYDEDTVMEALEATTNDPGLAGQVMQSIKDDKGIPTNLAGVWTARDDRALARCHQVASGKVRGDPEKAREAVQQRERLMDKHGIKKCRERAKYLGCLPWM